MDNAPGIQNLNQEKALFNHGITLDLGRAKIPNKNPVVDKSVREFKDKVIRFDPFSFLVTEPILFTPSGLVNFLQGKYCLAVTNLLAKN